LTKEEMEIGVTFILTTYGHNVLINELVENEIEFTVESLCEFNISGLSKIIHCSVESCQNQNLFLELKKYTDTNPSSPGFGYIKLKTNETDISSFIIISKRIILKEKIFCKNDYPHICPRCGADAYIGLFSVDCTKCKQNI
jgi:hypothetical protein